MSLKHAILGWLSWRPASGYDLKKAIASAGFLPWSGNNNQIYTTLLQMAKEGFVEAATEHREDGPTRKWYSITPLGRAELKSWLQLDADLPEWRNAFLTQLAWAEMLSAPELEGLVSRYEEQVRLALLMTTQANPLAPVTPARSQRERFIWEMITENRRSALEAELAWIGRLRNGL